MSTILLVADDPDAGADFRRLLVGDGHSVHIATAGPDLIDRVKAIRPHLVAVDASVLDVEGCPLCRSLRTDAVSSGIPVLILADRERLDTVVSGLKDGADDYVAKDEADEVILARVGRLTNYRKLADLAVLNHQLAQVGLLVAGIIHEIRSPLAVIRGHAELLKIMHPEKADVVDCVEPILRNALLLQSRLDHLMAAIRTGESTPLVVAIVPIVVESADLFQKGVDPRDALVIVSVDADNPNHTVVVDPGRLMQVILNLLANAHESIRSAHPEGRISVRVARDKEEGWLRIDVSDDGPGILLESLERIFEPFYTTKPHGNGFGLYLAREIIENQGGRLTACNPPNGGACFSIHLREASEALPA